MVNPYGYNFGAPLQPLLVPSKIPVLAGEKSAESYPMAPDSSVIALDSEKPLIWVIETDSAGYKKTVAAFSITPYTPEKPEDIGERLAKIEERMARYESYFDAARTNQSGDADGE